MSQSPNNPYAPRPTPGSTPPVFGPNVGGGGRGGPPGYEMWDDRPRGEPTLSVMAVLALIFSILCLTAPVGVILGIAALVLIAGSGGRKYGKGLAISAIVVGLLFTTFIGAIAIGGRQMLKLAEQQAFAPVGEMMTAIETQDHAKARVMFTDALSAQVSDAQLDAFRDQYRTEMGAFKNVPAGLGNIIQAYSQSGPAMQQMQARMAQHSRGQTDIPIPGVFENGSGIVVVQLNTSSPGVAPGSAKSVQNIALLTNSGKLILLVDPAPAPEAVPTVADPKLPAPLEPAPVPAPAAVPPAAPGGF